MQNRRITIAHGLVALAVAIVIHGLLASPLVRDAHAKDPKVIKTDIVSARVFNLLDGEGREVGHWAISKETGLPILRMFGKDGAPRFQLIVREKGALLLMSSRGSEEPTVMVGDAKTAAYLRPGEVFTMTKKGAASFSPTSRDFVEKSIELATGLKFPKSK